jgi:8-oxo-dGTP pyrophosphatase MutT (NUDIX family)
MNSDPSVARSSDAEPGQPEAGPVAFSASGSSPVPVPDVVADPADPADGPTPDEVRRQARPTYRLSAAVYAERGDHILLLRRSTGALTNRFFLPGGMVEAGEQPEEAARRELREESGLEIVGDLELIGAYPMRLHGLDCLQLSYRGVAGPGTVQLSDDHNDVSWVEPAVLRLVMNDELFAKIAQGDDDVLDLLHQVANDLDHYLARTGRTSPALAPEAMLPVAQV